jgi:hypothetical protein
MMTMRKTLFERCQGPGAVPLSALIARADARVAEIVERYGEDFHGLLDTIETEANAALAGKADRQAALMAAVQDVASSAATAGYHSVSAIAAHLNHCLGRHGLGGLGSARFVTLHIEAMRGAARSRASDWKPVLEELRQAASALDGRPRPA